MPRFYASSVRLKTLKIRSVFVPKVLIACRPTIRKPLNTKIVQFACKFHKKSKNYAFECFPPQALEYYFDLESWYNVGPSNEFNAKVACPLVKDMAKIFE